MVTDLFLCFVDDLFTAISNKQLTPFQAVETRRALGMMEKYSSLHLLYFLKSMIFSVNEHSIMKKADTLMRGIFTAQHPIIVILIK